MNVNCGGVRGRRFVRWRNSNAYRPALLSLDDSKSGRVARYVSRTGPRSCVLAVSSAGEGDSGRIRCRNPQRSPRGAERGAFASLYGGQGATDDRRGRSRHLPTQPQLTFAGTAKPCDAQAVVDPLPYIALMGAGFVIGAAGHLYRSNAAIAAGIGIILVATLVPIGVYLSDR